MQLRRYNMNIKELSEKIDSYHEEDTKRAKNYEYQNLSYILWGFALATVSIAYVNPNWITGIIAVIFLIGGFVSLWYSAKFRVK
jgi:Flp pilus assembly protein TadB